MGSANEQSQPINTHVPFDSKSDALPSTQQSGPFFTLSSGRTLETPTDKLPASATVNELLYDTTQPGKWASEGSESNCFGTYNQMNQHFQLTGEDELSASYAFNANRAHVNFTDLSLPSDFCKLSLNDPTRAQVDGRTSSYHWLLPSRTHSSDNLRNNTSNYIAPTELSFSETGYPATTVYRQYYPDPQPNPYLDLHHEKQGPALEQNISKYSRMDQRNVNSFHRDGTPYPPVQDFGLAPMNSFVKNSGQPYSGRSMHSLLEMANCMPGISNRGEVFKACQDGRCNFQTGMKEDNGPYWHGYELKQGSEIAQKQVSLRDISSNFAQKVRRRISEPNLSNSYRNVSSRGHNSFINSLSNRNMFSDPLSMDNFMNGSLQSDDQHLRNYLQENFDTRLITGTQFPKKFNSIDDITGCIFELALDQFGCRLLQDLISGTDDSEKIFVEIRDRVVEVMMNQFGNYLIQKLLDVFTESQLTKMLQEVTKAEGDIIKVCCDQYGTRVMQKIMVSISTPEQFSIIVSSLKSCIVALMKDTNGHHVALSCLDQLPQEYSKLLFEEAVSSCMELAVHKHGCRVLPKYVDIADEESRRRMLLGITSNSLYLSQDPYGNYVVQHIISGDVAVANAVVQQLSGHFCQLSMQQAASHVVETCLTYAGKEQLFCIVEDLITSPSFGELLVHQYGNYVAQKAINVSKEMPIHAVLLDAIKPYIPILRNDRFGKKVLACINFIR